MRLGEMLFDVTNKDMFCAYTVVVHILVLIAEGLQYAFTRS